MESSATQFFSVCSEQYRRIGAKCFFPSAIKISKFSVHLIERPMFFCLFTPKIIPIFVNLILVNFYSHCACWRVRADFSGHRRTLVEPLKCVACLIMLSERIGYAHRVHWGVQAAERCMTAGILKLARYAGIMIGRASCRPAVQKGCCIHVRQHLQWRGKEVTMYVYSLLKMVRWRAAF